MPADSSRVASQSLEAKVARGAALLDERCPSWRSEIKWDKLDMQSDKMDILGQLYGTFNKGMQLLLQPLIEIHGDYWSVANSYGFANNSFPEGLTKAWLKHHIKVPARPDSSPSGQMP